PACRSRVAIGRPILPSPMKATCAMRAAIARNASWKQSSQSRRQWFALKHVAKPPSAAASRTSIELLKLVDLIARRLRRWILRLVECGRRAERRNFRQLAARGRVHIHAEHHNGRNEQTERDQACDQRGPLEPFHVTPPGPAPSHERCQREGREMTESARFMPHDGVALQRRRT